MTQSNDQVPSEILDDSKLSVLLLNIQALRHKTYEMFLLFEEISFPKIVTITEHGLNADEPIFI